ncbi:MAG: class I SAM-dependent methyltransferase [Spirochaetales bacterium]
MRNRLFQGVHSFYDLFMVPLEAQWIVTLRNWLIPRAMGKVLELGAGTGVNLPYYRMDQIRELILTDRKGNSPAFRRMIRKRMGESDLKHAVGTHIRCKDADAEALPFGDDQFDIVVATLLLCSVEDPLRAVGEIHRILRSGGQFLFIEHVRPSAPVASKIADRITPAWRRIASGCHLNRDTLSTIEKGGFSIQDSRRSGDSVFVGGVARKA